MSKLCKYEKNCGSCKFLGMPYSEQMLLKQKIVSNCLKDFNAEIEPVVGSFYPFKYRNKIHLAFSSERGKINIGFFEEESKKIVDIQECILHDDWARKLILVLRKFLAKGQVQIFDTEKESGNLRYAVARYLDGSLLLTLVIYQKFISGLNFLFDDLKKEFKEVGIYLNINQTKSSAVFSNNFIHKMGIKKQDAKMLGIHFQLMPQTFYQINQAIATKIYSRVIDLIGAQKGQIVLDLYSGIGISTMLLAKSGAQIISVELVQESVAEAKRLANINHFNNISFYCGKCEDILPQIFPTNTNTNTNNPELQLQNQEQTFTKNANTNKNTTELQLQNQVQTFTKTANTNNHELQLQTLKQTFTKNANTNTNANNPQLQNQEQTFTKNANTPESTNTAELIVFLDPPRKGCGTAVMNTILNLAPSKIIYLSCNPQSLSQDILPLIADYRPTTITPYDMFPQTPHVETLCCFTRK